MNRRLLSLAAVLPALLASPALLSAQEEKKDPPAEKQEKPAEKAEEKAEEKPSEEKPAEEKPAAGAEKEPEKPEAEPKPGDADAQAKFSREAPEVAAAWKSASQRVRESVVRLVNKSDKQIGYACQVHENGLLITKASELKDRKGVPLEGVEAVFPEGLRLPVRILDQHPKHDLALIHVPARGLRPIEWNTEAPTTPGTFVAAVDQVGDPVASGVLSVLTRSLDESSRGYLGIMLESGEKGVHISLVSPKSPAEAAGLKDKDIVRSIEGTEVTTVADAIRKIGSFKPRQEVRILIRRGEEEKEIKATLGSRAAQVGPAGKGEDIRNFMAGRLSERRTDFPSVVQNDLVLQPNECGGPLVDLDGKVLGISIARSGRIESLAIPSATLTELLKDSGATGRFHRPDLETLRKQRATLEREADSMKKELEELKAQIDEAEGKKNPEEKPEKK